LKSWLNRVCFYFAALDQINFAGLANFKDYLGRLLNTECHTFFGNSALGF